MDIVKYILYFGKDEKFVEELEFYSKVTIKTNHLIKKFDYTTSILFEETSKTIPNIIYIDFSTLEEKEEALEQTLFLKRNPTFHATLFVAVLSEGEDKSFQRILCVSGFSLIHHKGVESDNLYPIALYMGLGENTKIQQFAKAQNINKELIIGQCSHIVSVSKDRIIIESDLDESDSKIDLGLELFTSYPRHSFDIQEQWRLATKGHVFEAYQLKIPKAGAWEDEEDYHLSDETMETWIDNHLHELNKDIISIFVLTRNLEHNQSCFDLHKKYPQYQIILKSELDKNTLADEVNYYRPRLILFDNDPDDHDYLNQLEFLIPSLKSLDTNPILVVSNIPSQSEALKKLYNYEKVSATPKALDSNMLKLYIDRYHQKAPLIDDPNVPIYSLKAHSHLKKIDFFFNAKVISLTEQEMVFISPYDLPMFTTIHIELPIDCCLTIIPPFQELSSDAFGKSYMAVFHGLTEDEHATLRKFINQIIYEPLKSFDKDIVKAVLEQKLIEEEEESAESQKSEATKNTDESKKDEKEYESFKRPEIEGKSKL